VTTPANQHPALADRIADALGAHRNGTASDGRGWFRTTEERAELHDVAAAVMAVVQPELDARDAEIARLTAERDQARADLNATARNRDQYRAAVAAVSLVPVRRREDGREYIAAADIRAALATTTVASGCGCQTDAHPGHYPTCPTTATTGA
jgi:hypothetical protein